MRVKVILSGKVETHREDFNGVRGGLIMLSS
jgi:hypothetical protein